MFESLYSLGLALMDLNLNCEKTFEWKCNIFSGNLTYIDHIGQKFDSTISNLVIK